MLVNNTLQPTGEMKEEITPFVKSIALETEAAVLENLFLQVTVVANVFFLNKVIVSCVLLASDWGKKSEEATGRKRA
jgi:hypothetical protein